MKTILTPAIHFNKANFYSDDNHILKNITGSFYEGTITTLVGPSGAGKTTLLKLCNGLYLQFQGKFLLKIKNSYI